MPIYEYKCQDCGKISEIITSVARKNKDITCKNCGSKNVIKTISAPAQVTIADKSHAPSNSQGCCGTTNPCENPKRCCEK